MPYKCPVARKAYDKKYAKKWYAANKEGRRLYRLKILYDITVDAVCKMLESQGGVCAICQTSDFGKRGPMVDHCHATGVVRGILCHSCNLGIGFLRDSSDLLRSATVYLEAPR